MPVTLPVDAPVFRNWPKSVRLAAEPIKLNRKYGVPLAGLTSILKVTVSPSSTCRPGQVVSRSPLRLPLVPQFGRGAGTVAAGGDGEVLRR